MEQNYLNSPRLNSNIGQVRQEESPIEDERIIYDPISMPFNQKHLPIANITRLMKKSLKPKVKKSLKNTKGKSGKKCKRNSSRVRLRIHQLHHLRSRPTVQNGEKENSQRRRYLDKFGCPWIRKIRGNLKAVFVKIPKCTFSPYD